MLARLSHYTRVPVRIWITPADELVDAPTHCGPAPAPPPSTPGVPLRDVHEAASHPDLRITRRYARGRRSLDRRATYIVATFLAGTSR